MIQAATDWRLSRFELLSYAGLVTRRFERECIFNIAVFLEVQEK